MSEIITDKLTGKTSAGDVTITSEGGAVTMQLQQGVAKAWINVDGSAITSSADLTGVRDSFNVASIVDAATGSHTLNFSSSFNNDDYVVTSGSTQATGVSNTYGYGLVSSGSNTVSNMTTSAFPYKTGYFGGSQVEDMVYTAFSFQGDLA